MAKTKDASTAIISGSRKHTTVKKKALDGRQYPGVGGSKRKRFNANCYKALFIPQRIRIESDDKGVPEGQDNSPRDNASTNGDMDKVLKVQNNIRVQEADDEAKKAVLDKQLMDTDQVECVGGNMEKQIGGECSPSNRNADYDACADNDNHIFHTSSSRHDIENQQELDPCDKVTGTCKAAGVTENEVNNDAATNVQNYGNISNSSKFVEFWVPVQLSNVQLEQYCAALLSNAMVLRCGSKDTVGGALHDIFISNRKCCNHPYVVDPTLHSKILKDQEPTMLKLDADIKASGKLQFLDLILPEVKKRQLRVLILFQSTTVTTKGVPSVWEMLFDFVHQRFGEDSYEFVLTGLQPSTRQTALNKFNKDMSIPFFLLEHRACHASIKLSSVDIIVIFDSDLTPTNDLKSLQKISVDSQSEQIMIFRLYSSSTLEEKILKLAETNESRLHNVRSRYDALLKWGASDLFDRLTKFHRGSVFSISSEESFSKDVMEEFLYLISNKSESNDKSKSIIMRVQNFGIYGKNSETKTHLPDGDQPHIFWKNLLEGRLPVWKFVSFLTPRQKKQPHYLDGTTKGISTEDGGGVKIRRKTVKPVIEGEAGGVNEGGSGVPTHYEPQSSSGDRFQSTAVGDEKSLQDQLKATMSELSNVLKLSDDVKITVEKFLEFVLENYRLSSEHTSTLQALMISMCWIGSALQNIKIDRLESFDIAKKHLKFICQLEEAYSVYGKLQSAKEAFVQTERPAASKECISSPQRAKLDTEKSQHTKSYREEINKFYREWEEQRVNLEKNYRMEQARVRSMHRTLSLRSEKMTQLKVNFVSKLEKHGKLREVYLKELKARQLTAKDGHPLHGPRDNSPEVGPSHDELVDRINVSIPNATEGDGVYDVDLTGCHTSEKHMTDAIVSSGPIGEVSTQHHDDIENDVAREVDSPATKHPNEASNDVVPHVVSPKIGMPAGNCNKEKAADGGEDHRDLYGSSSNPPSADVSPGVTIPETENQSLQVQDKQGPAGPNSLVEIDVKYRPFLDAGQLGQIILEASSLDPHDEPSLFAENQSDMLPQTEILLEPICEQIPEAPTPPITAEIQNLNTSSLTLNMIDNVNHVGPLTPNHANPLQAEEERLRVAMDDVVKLHEETKERLKSECEEEIAKMAAQISLKYEAKCQEEEAAFHLNKKEIDANVKLAVMNKILAAAFRSKCQDLTLSGDAGKQQEMEDFAQFDAKCDTRHNITAFLDDSKDSAEPFRPLIVFLSRSRIFTAITASATIYRDHVGQFWRNATINSDLDYTRLISTVHGRQVIITEQLIREVLRFEDDTDMPLQFPNEFIVGAMNRIGYTGSHSDQYRKGHLTRVWRWLMHIFILCLSNRKAGYDGTSHRTVSAMLALVYNKPYNYSGYIFRSMVDNAHLGDARWFMYPRFVQLMINRELSGLATDATRVYRQTPMSNRIFGVMSSDGKGVTPRPDIPLFGHLIDPNYQAPANDGYLDPVAPQQVFEEAALEDVPVHATENPLEDVYLTVDAQGNLQIAQTLQETSESFSDSFFAEPADGGSTDSDSEGLVPHPREHDLIRRTNPRKFLRIQRRISQGRKYVPAREKRVRETEDVEFVPPPKKSQAARQVSTSSQLPGPQVELPVRPLPSVIEDLLKRMDTMQYTMDTQAARIEVVEKENADLRSRVVALESQLIVSGEIGDRERPNVTPPETENVSIDSGNETARLDYFSTNCSKRISQKSDQKSQN